MALQSYTYGGFNLNDGVNYLRQSTDFSTVDVQQSLLQLGRYAGVKKTGELIGARTLSLTIKVKSNTVPPTRADLETQIDRLLLALNKRQQNLVLHAADGRYFIADCTKASIPVRVGNVTSVVATLTFICQQPYAYSANPLSYDTGNVLTTLVLGSIYHTGARTITSAGTISAPCTITITNTGTPAVTSVQINQQSDAQSLYIGTSGLPALSLATNDYLLINTDPNGGYTIYKNGSGSPLQYQGIFPVMEPTSTVWDIDVGASSAPTVRVQWAWTPRYLS